MPLIGMKSLCQKFSFVRILSAGLFNVYVFAVSRTPDRRRLMPMIRRRDHQCIEILLLYKFPDIMNDSRLASRVFQSRQAVLNGLLFHIADISHLYVGSL